MKVFLSIGSNLGNRKENCLKAIEEIKKISIKIKKISSLYETEPWGIKDQPSFINLAIEVETTISPKELLSAIKEIEKTLERKETYRWGPRTIDIDILLYDNLIIDDNDLKIPHAHMHERDFVLKPLSEIAPDTIHPVLKKPILQIYNNLCKQD